MNRLDTKLKDLNKQLTVPDIKPEDETIIRKKIQERQENLKPMYHQVSKTRLIFYYK